jgi:hypothetical protein
VSGPDSFAIIQTTIVFPNKEQGLSQMTLIHRLSTPVGSLLLIGIVVLLAACSTAGSTPSPPTATAAFHTTLKTTDGQFVVQFSVTPNRLGLNVFTVGWRMLAAGSPHPRCRPSCQPRCLIWIWEPIRLTCNRMGTVSTAHKGRSRWEVTGRFAFSCAHRTLLCTKLV